MELFEYCMPCLGNRVPPRQQSAGKSLLVTDQPGSMPFRDDPAETFVDILRSSNDSGKLLQERLESTIAASSLTDAIAERILHGVEDILRRGAKMADAMAKAAADAEDVAFEYAQKHPCYAALIAAGTILALGTLVILAPWILDALGFASKGPRIGSFAARWMSSIGNVPKGSIYSYLQRLGMTWRA